MRLILSLACVVVATSLQLTPSVLRPANRGLSRSGEIVCGRKGRPKMPGGGGGAAAYNQPQTQAPKASPDGMPMFYLYCRSGAGKPWYPVSAMKGDGQSKGLISAWLGSPFAKGVFKNRLDSGMARSIFESERRLAVLATEQYAHMKKLKSSLEWGYKIVDNEVMVKEAAGEIEKQKIIPVSRDMMTDSLVDQAKKALNL